MKLKHLLTGDDDSLGSDVLHDSWRDVVLVIALQTLQEFQVAQQFLRRSPEILDHLAGSARVRFTLGLNAQHDTHRLHHNLHSTRRILEITNWLVFL